LSELSHRKLCFRQWRLLEHLTEEDVETPMNIGASLVSALERFREFPESELQP